MGSFDIVAKGDLRFYVIDDLKKQRASGGQRETESLNEALKWFHDLNDDCRGIPALGVTKGPLSLDLLHRVNGCNVLVQEYKTRDASETLKAIAPVLDKVARYLAGEVDVRYTYSFDFFDRIGKSCPVVVPIGSMNGELDSSYCADKRLKTVSGFGFDAVNQVLIDGHGWVDFRDMREAPEEFAENGILHIEGVNVNYTLKQNLTGINGRMDVTPHDFARMLQDVNREFSLRVLDVRLGHLYIVDSFDELKDAVRAWYELPADLTAQVNQTVGYSYQEVVFNGIDDDLEEITYDAAAKMYGFDACNVARLIADAEGMANKMVCGRGNAGMELV